MANLNGKQLAEFGIVTGPLGEDNIAQHGIDLNVVKIERLLGGGLIPKVGKTILGDRELVNPYIPDALENEDIIWKLQPGVYDVTFAQGCKIPKDQMLLIRQRSSLLRNGVIIHSSVFDAGFETENMGTIMVVNLPITIVFEARIAQIYAHHCNDVENLYEGQFQKDQQRNK